MPNRSFPTTTVPGHATHPGVGRKRALRWAALTLLLLLAAVAASRA